MKKGYSYVKYGVFLKNLLFDLQMSFDETHEILQITTFVGVGGACDKKSQTDPIIELWKWPEIKKEKQKWTDACSKSHSHYF